MNAILTLTYNSEKYLQELLESTKNFDGIHYFVDSNSSDKTLEKIKEHCKTEFKVIKLLEKVNIGIARNIGLIQMVKDNIDIFFNIDSDDFVDEDYFSNMLNISEDIHWVVSSYKRTDGIFVDIRDDVTLEQQRNYNSFSAFVAARPETVLQVGGYSPTAVAEDWDLWVRMLAYGNKYSVNHKGGYNYRVYPESHSYKVKNIEANTIKLVNSYIFNW